MLRARWALPSLLALTLAAVLGLTAGPANAATGSVQVGPTATFIVQGLALQIPVTVSLTCDEGFTFGEVEVGVTQKSGRSVIQGFAEATIDCTGQPQTLTLQTSFVTGAFHGGPALASAQLLQCFDGECLDTGIGTSTQITIRGS